MRYLYYRQNPVSGYLMRVLLMQGMKMKTKLIVCFKYVFMEDDF